MRSELRVFIDIIMNSVRPAKFDILEIRTRSRFSKVRPAPKFMLNLLFPHKDIVNSVNSLKFSAGGKDLLNLLSLLNLLHLLDKLLNSQPTC